MNSSSTPNGQAGLVQNWNLTLKITGQNSIFGGKISATNGYGMIQQAIDPVFKLSELQRSITFPSPILSPKQIIVEGLYADGIDSDLTYGFIVYFAEGELYFPYL